MKSLNVGSTNKLEENIREVEYKSIVSDKEITIKLIIENNDIWVTQKIVALLFDISVNTANEHINNVLDYFDANNHVKYFNITRKEGSRLVKRKITHYSSDILFNVALKGSYFDRMNEVIEFMGLNELNKKFYKVVPIKEQNFKRMLFSTFKDILEIIPQYRVKNYRIDFFIPKINLAIEFDEKHHRKYIKEDIIRQNYIQNKYGIKFIRVKEGEELEGINKILKFMLKTKYKYK